MESSFICLQFIQTYNHIITNLIFKRKEGKFFLHSGDKIPLWHPQTQIYLFSYNIDISCHFFFCSLRRIRYLIPLAQPRLSRESVGWQSFRIQGRRSAAYLFFGCYFHCRSLCQPVGCVPRQSFMFLYASSFRRTAAVVRQGGHVDYLDYFDACAMNGTDSGLASVTGSFYIRFYFAQSQIVCYFRAVLRCHLCGIGSVLLRATEAHFACRWPGDYLTLAVG